MQAHRVFLQFNRTKGLTSFNTPATIRRRFQPTRSSTTNNSTPVTNLNESAPSNDKVVTNLHPTSSPADAAGPVTATQSSALLDVPTEYSQGLKIFHWGMAVGVIGCVGLVKGAGQLDKDEKEKKANMMFYHKSIGLLLLGALVPRVALRLSSKIPPMVDGSKLEHMAANTAHYALYGALTFLPITGVAMGYYSGFGLPFFVTTIPGASEENKNKELSTNAWKAHTAVGSVFPFLLAAHVGGALLHVARGHRIFRRINPFRSAASGSSKAL